MAIHHTGAVRLSLRWKITGGFGFLLALIALLGWVTLSLFGSLRTVQRQVFDDAIPGLIAVDEIVRSYTAQSAAARGFIIDTEQSLLAQYRREVDQAELWEERARELFTDREESELLDDLAAAGVRFQTLVDEQVVPLAAAGNRSQAIRVLSNEASTLISEIEFLGQLLRSAQDRQVAQSEGDLQARSNQVLLIVVVVVVGSLAIGLTVAILLPRRLSSNISRLVEATRAIGRGDFDQKIEVESRDEIEELALHLKEMQAGLKRLQQLARQDHELEIAASIQQNLLQRTLPNTPGVRVVPLQRQTNLVGGDWYDVDVSGRSLNIVVGDASGKGIAAALMATVALSVLRAERGLGASPKRVIARANEALLDATDPDSFTTLVYATVDLHSGEVRWLNMGHPSPFVLRSGVREPTGDGVRGYYLEGPRNRALGWFDDPGLAETVAHLHPGDKLVLYTDGWLEAKSPDGEVFGEHRLAEALLRLAPLDAEALGAELVGDVERFSAGKLDDDLTMLVIEFQGAPRERGAQAREAGEEPWHSRR